MKGKIISALLLAVALGGGAVRLAAQGQPSGQLPADLLVRLVALDLETEPGYAKSAAFKALRPDVQAAALAMVKADRRHVEIAKLKREAESWAVFVCVVGGVLWLMGAVTVRLLAGFAKRRRRGEPERRRGGGERSCGTCAGFGRLAASR